MDRAEAVKILEIQLDVTEVNTPSCIALHEAIDLAIEALKEPTGDYEFFGGEYAKEGDAESATTTDCISRQAAIEAFCYDCRKLKPGQCEHWYSCRSQKELRSLPPVTPTERTGEWIPKVGHKDEIYIMPLICSECDAEIITDHSNYCGNCGAKMGGDAE